MKRLFAILASAFTVFAFASCGPENPDNPQKPDDKGGKENKDIPALVLSAANIDVVGLEGDFMAIVDNAAKTIKINLEYVDKDNAQALTVRFLNLPEGFTAEFQGTFNYSNNATQTVVFKYGEEKAAEYVISVAVGAADPKFLTLTVAGINALGGEVHLSSATSLSSLVVEFTVDPEETVVSVGGEAISSGDAVDFNNTLSTVTFTLTVGEASNTFDVTVVTSGIKRVTRVWGHYAKPKNGEDDWFQTEAIDNNGNWLRTCALTNDYLFVAQHAGSALGAYVLSLTDGSIVKRLSVEGIAGGTHATSCIRSIPDGDGGYKLLQCNLVLNTAASPLKVYKYDDKDSDPVQVLSYANPDNQRLGDKMGVWGTWKDGVVSFMAQAGTPRKLYLFKISNGVIEETPTVVELGELNSYGQAYWYSDTEIMTSSVGTAPRVFSVSNNTYTQTLEASGAVLGTSNQGFSFFTFNDQKYMASVKLEGNNSDGSLNIMALNGETLKEAIENIDPNAVFKYGIGDPIEIGITGKPVGNSLADCTVREIGGVTYIAAVVADNGVSLFKPE